VSGPRTRFLAEHLRGQRSALVGVLAWSAAEAAPAFCSGLFVQQAIDHGFKAGHLLTGLAWLAALLLLWGFGALATKAIYPHLSDTVEPMRDSMVTAVVRAMLRRAVRGRSGAGGAEVAQATVQVETVRALFTTVLRSNRAVASAAVAALGGLATLSPFFVVVVVGCVLVAVGLFLVVLRVMVRSYRGVVHYGERVGAEAAPVTNGMRDVVAAGAGDRAAREVGVTIEAEAEALRAFARASALRVPVVAIGSYLPLVGVLAISPWLVAQRGLTAGAVVGGLYYLLSGLQPAIQTLVKAGGTILSHLSVLLGRLAETTETPAPPPSVTARRLPVGSSVTVTRLSFAYAPGAEPVIRDLSLWLPEGRHVAVVGPSGVGKSTLASLLAGLERPRSGTALLGGMPLDVVDETYLRRTVALIPQEAYVFAGSLAENVTYLRPEASRAEIERAGAAVGLDVLVERLGGYEAEIPPGGGTLSAGERQLVALARVYLSPASVVILDEGTCYLDPVAEARAEEAFARRGGTLVVIAHRISSAARAERILVMDGAEAVEGTHEELLTESAMYADLVGNWQASEAVPEPSEPVTVEATG
jgi:ATP-binding cassette subfamily C protein